jgi:oligopeptide transport system permease protein OppB
MPYIVKYTLKRIGLLIAATFIILTITFFLVKMLPGEAMMGSEVAQNAYCMEQVRLGYFVRFLEETDGYGPVKLIYNDPTGLTYYYYQKPIVLQYGAWLTGIFTRWDWGVSSAISPSSSAIYIIAQRLGPSIKVNIFAMLVSVPLGFLLGIWAALKKNKATDGVISTLVMVMISVPSFVVISLLMLLLCFRLQWLPSQWPTGADVAFGERAAGYVIPVLSLSFGSIAAFTRYTRAELCEVMSSDFLLLARTKGLSKSQCVVRHAMRNSLVPIVPMIIGQFVGILSGSMVLEQLYGIPGIGTLFVDCISKKDYNVLFVDMAIYTVIGLFANLLVDLSYGIVDPRIRMGAKAA